MSSDEPNVGDTMRNFWRSDMPFPKRVAVAMRNNFLKARHRKNCCGNHGEPGC
ncbi:MAG: hypothetical protein WD826_03425 [Actinomycetota bacterium]